MALLEELKDLSILTKVGGVVDVNGVCGANTGIQTDGVDDRAHKAGVISSGLKLHSISLLLDPGVQVGDGFFLSQLDASGNGFFLDLTGSDGLKISARVDISNRIEFTKASSGLGGNGLVHIVGTIDGNTNDLKIYVDKVEVGISTIVVGAGFNSGYTASAVAAQFSVSGKQNGSNFYNGNTFYIRQFDSVLSQSEVDDEFDLAQTCGATPLSLNKKLSLLFSNPF